MKITVHTLTSDLRNSGTETQVFGTLSAFLAELSMIVDEHIDRALAWDHPERRAEAGALRQMIDEGNFAEAWDRLMDGRDTPASLLLDDYYWTDMHEIDIPELDELETLRAENASLRAGAHRCPECGVPIAEAQATCGRSECCYAFCDDPEPR